MSVFLNPPWRASITGSSKSAKSSYVSSSPATQPTVMIKGWPKQTNIWCHNEPKLMRPQYRGSFCEGISIVKWRKKHFITGKIEISERVLRFLLSSVYVSLANIKKFNELNVTRSFCPSIVVFCFDSVAKSCGMGKIFHQRRLMWWKEMLSDKIICTSFHNSVILHIFISMFYLKITFRVRWIYTLVSCKDRKIQLDSRETVNRVLHQSNKMTSYWWNA